MKHYSVIYSFFDKVVLRHPVIVIVCVFAVVGFLALGIKNFRLDASPETLVLENDEDLRYSRLINARLFLADADRLGNYFIEENPATRVFRFLDLEMVSYHQAYSGEKKIEMLAKFIKSARAEGLLTPERLGEFVIVCLGAHGRSADLAERLLAEVS